MFKPIILQMICDRKTFDSEQNNNSKEKEKAKVQDIIL